MQHVASELKAWEAPTLDDPESPLEFRLKYAVKIAFQRSDRGWIGQIPLGFEGAYLQAASVENRFAPFEQRYPLALESRIQLALPSGHKLKSLLQSPREFKDPYLECRVEPGMAQDGSELTVAAQVTLLSGRHAANRYAAYCRSLKRAQETLTLKVTLEATGRTSSP